LYQHRQDQAIGITWMSGRVKGVLWYYNQLQSNQLAQAMTAYYLNETIQQKAAKIDELATQGQTAKDKKAILKEMIDLEIELDIAKAMLDGIEENPTQE